MKKVYVQAYLNCNLGDDLFIRCLAERYPNTIFYIRTTLNYKKIFKDLKNIKIIPQTDSSQNILLKKVFDRINHWYKTHSNILIYIGGSIFMEYENWENMITWYNYLFSSNKTYVIGANFGPYKSIKYRDNLKALFPKVEDICFRDTYSYELFKELSNVRYAPDILFSFEYSPCVIKTTKKKLFLSVIDLKSRDSFPINLSEFDNDYQKLLIHIINLYVNIGYEITICGFCENEYDHKFINELIDNLSPYLRLSINVLNYNGNNWKEILNEIKSSDYVVSTRFHCLIFSLIYQVPVLPLIYSNKIENVLKDLKFQGNYISITNIPKDLKDSFIMYNERKKIVLNDDILSNIKKNSLEHFKKVDEALR